MATVEIKGSKIEGNNTLKLSFSKPLTYQEQLSFTGSVSQRIGSLGPSTISVNPMRPTKSPEIWFTLGKSYYIFIRPNNLILHARHARLDFKNDPVDAQLENIVRTAEY